MKVNIGNYPKGDSERKIDVRIDPHDTWSMYNTLSHIIVPMLKQLKETKQGSPNVDDEDVPEHLRSSNAPPTENEWDADEHYHTRWSWVLDEMIWTFEQHQTEWEDQFTHGNIDLYVNEDGYLATGPNHTMHIDNKSKNKHVERMKHGRMLFAKYYECLWD